MFRNLVFICLLVFTFASCKQDDAILNSAEKNKWFLVSENNTEQYVDKIFFINSNSGWIIGNNGTMLKTTDGGYTWKTELSNTSKNLREIFFIDEDKGWITGLDNTFLRTSDGGKVWQQINIYDDTTKHNTDIYFTHEQNGWFLNNYGEVFKTRNRDKRFQIYKKANEYIADQALWVFSVAPFGLYGVNEEVEFVPHVSQYLYLDYSSVTDSHWSVRGKNN